jgi:aspartate/tyrosine/aromatic aminotransferase
VDLGIGVYRNAAGQTPILDVVKEAERRLIETQDSKTYIGSAGSPAFNEAMRDLTFAGAVPGERIAMLQTPGGSGSLRVAAGVILRARKDATVWASGPTWANHVPLLGGAGLELRTYRYYDDERKTLDLEAMLDALHDIPKGDVVLLHASCHNPTGIDPDVEQWRAIADVIVERELLPFVDIAYQGFATDPDTDVFIVRELAGRVPEMVVCTSCSKNFGLYRDRVGSLSFVAADHATVTTVDSLALNVVRTMYSVPPDHGAAVVAHILGDTTLRADWLAELDGMRERLQGMRALLVEQLGRTAPAHDFSHIATGKGMFSHLGVAVEQVAQLKSEFGIYLVDSSRINVCGITKDNVAYLAESVAAVL